MDGIYELGNAAIDGDIDKVKHLIEQGVPVNDAPERGRSPLYWASMNGRSDVVKLLLESGANPNFQDRYGKSPLHYASSDGHGDIVKLLLEHGANVDIQSLQDGESPLHYASEYGHGDTVKLLLEHGAIVDIQSPKNGQSPLHYASIVGHGDTVKLLLEHGANVDIQSPKDKETPLHGACRWYDPSNQKRIDTCVILIESGADHKIIDKDGKTPVDVLGTYLGRPMIDIRSDEARPIRKAIERREYSLLLEETVPVKIVKIFLVGDPEAGKSTIKRTLTTSTKPNQPYIPTPGIDIGTYQVNDIGDVSIWDSAGHSEFHVTHGLLLGSQNAVAVVVYDINKPDSYTRLCYWLRFLKSGHRDSAQERLKIVIVATHLDTFFNKTDAFELAKKNISEIRAFYGEELDISAELHILNAREAKSEEMVKFRMTLKDATTEIKGSRRLPKLCEAILKHKSTWVNPKSPVLSFQDYVARVKEVDPLVSPKIVRVSANYLQDMGEIFLAKRDETIIYVVLVVNWLAYNIIGPTLGGDSFSGHFEQLLEPKFSYSRRELERFFKGVDDFSLLSQLLQALELMATFDGRTFIIPAKIPSTRSGTSTRSEFKKGRTVFTADRKSMVSPTVFGTIQIRIMELFKTRGNRPKVTRESLQFGNQTIALVEDVGERDAINFAVEHSDGNAESSFKDLEKITDIIVTTLYGLSPGTTVAIGYLSPRSIQQSPTLTSVQHYTMDELEAGESHDGTVFHKTLQIGEKTTDVLIAGGDPHFLRKNGLSCDYQWMLQTPKNLLFRLLDSKKEYLPLAEILNIDATELVTIEKNCEKSKKSCTASVLNHWCATSGQRMTLEMFGRLLIYRDMIGNAEAVDIIDDMLQQLGQQVVTPMNTLFQLLDSKKEYRSLAQILSIDATELATIEKNCEEAKKSCTESVFHHWCATSGQRMTLERLRSMLRDPEAVDIVTDMLKQQNDMLKQLGQQVVHAAPEPTRHDSESDSEIMELEAEVELPTISELSIAFENISLTEDNDPTVSCQVDSRGAELRIPNTGVGLKIPQGAIQDSQKVRVNLSLPMAEEDHPPLEDGHTLISPIVRCEPEGLRFLKPVELTLPSNAVNLTGVDVTLWTRSKRTGPWVKILETQDSSQPSRQMNSVDVQSNTIKVAMWHFCDDCTSAVTDKNVNIVVYQNPRSLVKSSDAIVTVYAVAPCMVQTVELLQREQGVKVSVMTCFRLCPTNDDLQISIREVQPQPDWSPAAADKKIKYNSLAVRPNAAQNRQFKFTKTDSAVNTIKGDLILRQNDEEETIFFDTNLAPQGGAIPKRRRLDSDDAESKRPRTSEGGAIPKKRRLDSDDAESSEGQKMISDREIYDVAYIAHLSHDQLEVIYMVLDISLRDVENVKRQTDSNDFKIQATRVLKHWRATRGRDATKEAIIDALEECGWKEAKEILEQKWKHKKR